MENVGTAPWLKRLLVHYVERMQILIEIGSYLHVAMHLHLRLSAYSASRNNAVTSLLNLDAIMDSRESMAVWIAEALRCASCSYDVAAFAIALELASTRVVPVVVIHCGSQGN